MGGVQPAAIQNNELDQSRQLGKAMPGRQAADVVFADQIDEFSAGLALTKCFHGLDRVRRRRTLQLQGVESETRFAFYRRAQHLQPDSRRRRFPLEFVGRERGRNEEHAVEFQRFDRIARQDQMPVMNRIESAAEDADLFQAILFVATALVAVFVSGDDMKLAMTL